MQLLYTVYHDVIFNSFQISSWVDMTNERIQEPPFEIEKETQCSISKTVMKTTLKIWKTDVSLSEIQFQLIL